MGEYVLLGGLFLLSLSILLIHRASELKKGLKRNIFLISSALNSTLIFILIFFNLVNGSLNPAAGILFIYNTAIFSGLIIHYFINTVKEKEHSKPLYHLNTKFDLENQGQ